MGLCRSVQVEPQGRSGSGTRAHLDPGWARCTNLETHVAQILPMPQFGQSFLPKVQPIEIVNCKVTFDTFGYG